MLSSWIPALSTSALLAVVAWLARSVISTRLRASVEHEFNSKIEGLKGQLRESEERLIAELRRREVELSALRSGALTALASRQVALDKRRLEAVDQIWEAYTGLAPARFVSNMMSSLKFEAAAAEAAKSERAREAFKLMGGGIDPKLINQASAAKARPFVTPMVWAVFSAYQAIVAHSIARWTILTTGIGNPKLVEDEGVKKLILAVLPTYGEYLQKHGAAAFYYVLEPLESRLLEEIGAMLKGGVDDHASVEQAARIVSLANSVATADKKASAPAA